MAEKLVFRTISLLTHKLRDLMADSAAFSDVRVHMGYPAAMSDRFAWVSYSKKARRELVASDHALFKNALTMGGGISVAQFTGEDWQPVEDALLTLTDAFEGLINADPTLGKLCMDSWLSDTETIESADSETKGRLTAIFELTVIVYV